MLGISTGLLWAPCAGPILGLILTGAAIQGPGARSSFLLLSFALGAATSLGIALFAAGLALRWYAIVHLGRFFTVNVSIAADHRLIDTGPYRIVRHPSYTGALMAFLGLGLCIANWASLLSLLVPICLVFLRRIHVEEAVLLQALGDQYRDYMRRTKRLIPALY